MTEPRVTVVALTRVLAGVGMAGLVAGALLTGEALAGQRTLYLTLTAVGVAALAWLYRRASDGAEGLVVTALLGVLLFAYFARYYVALLLRVDGRTDFLTLLFGLDFGTGLLAPDLVIESYRVMIGALAGLALATMVVGRTSSSPAPRLQPATGDGHVGSNERLLLGLAVGLSAVSAVVHYLLLGLERGAPELPWRLAGILALVRNVLIPSLGLLVVWAAERVGDRRHAGLGVLFLVAHGVGSAVLTSSRGQLVSPLVSLALLWLVTGRFTRRRVVGLALLSPLLALAFPILGAYRNLAGAPLEDVVTGVGAALQNLDTGDSGLPLWTSVALALAGRLNGFDSLARIVDWQAAEGFTGWSWLRPVQESVTATFTFDIMNVPPEWATAVSPSLLGYFYFRTGSALATAGFVAAWAVGWCLLFRWLVREDLRATEVSFAVVGWTFILLSNEGTLEGLPLFAAAGAAVIVMNHVVARSLEAPSPQV